MSAETWIVLAILAGLVILWCWPGGDWLERERAMRKRWCDENLQQAYFDSLHYPEKKPCPVCEGRGWVEYAKLTGLTECCPGCGGTGERKP